MPTIHPAELEAFMQAVFAAVGAPPDVAAGVAGPLVGADLRGIDSHGVMRAPRYCARVQRGELNPAARPDVSRRDGASAVIDGGWGFGQVAAQRGTTLAIEICREHGQAGVAISRTHHIGRLGEYAETLARAGLAGLVIAAGGDRGGSVTVHGSRERLLGTNPLAIAVPTPSSHPPLVMDFATSAVAEGRLALARRSGMDVPPGCLLDREGRPSTHPDDYYAGGALLPFGAHKGSALMLMIEILATTLAASAPICLPAYDKGNPAFILAWSIERFTALDHYHELVGQLLSRIRDSAPADGFSEVLLPGELEARRLRERQTSGIPLSEGTWRELTSLASALSVAPPTAGREPLRPARD